ncbi:uncharacterized protein LOC109862528 isoform X2 [Pseudomyrmex gracilis]|uniref:uncharacterized protein LOC109862528 isoform X2 n=1 Tax=Pseudomyrmex gracilis TaxID=219809 RepID=UPI0009959569|nr:uncharacterized protein LOC109862528 isoform X2 [Pseudomyrmex gracilis]
MGESGKHIVRSTGTSKGLETSATSLHSSGQDSGIVARTSCHCSHSSSPSSDESSNGYEDSLKSLQRQERGNNVLRGNHDSVIEKRANLAMKRRRFHSFSNGESIYTHEMTLQKEQHCCNSTDKRQKAEHHRAHSEAENNITETVINEHPGTEISC